MKTVQDIYFQVLAMNKQRLPPEQISRKIVEAWRAEDPGVVYERGSINAVRFEFPNGELISFDGIRWHHDKRQVVSLLRWFRSWLLGWGRVVWF